jgi:hypothetical protein
MRPAPPETPDTRGQRCLLVTFGCQSREKPVHGFPRGFIKSSHGLSMPRQLIPMNPQDVINFANTQALAIYDMLRLYVLA